jgi:hypothetical protein
MWPVVHDEYDSFPAGPGRMWHSNSHMDESCWGPFFPSLCEKLNRMDVSRPWQQDADIDKKKAFSLPSSRAEGKRRGSYERTKSDSKDLDTCWPEQRGSHRSRSCWRDKSPWAFQLLCYHPAPLGGDSIICSSFHCVEWVPGP